MLVFETTGADRSPETMGRAMANVGLDTFNLMATSLASRTALRVALQAPGRIRALVLEAPRGERDADLERRLPSLATPTLVLCGTRDRGDAPATGRILKALLPGGHLVFVYDATDAISADRPEALRRGGRRLFRAPRGVRHQPHLDGDPPVRRAMARRKRAARRGRARRSERTPVERLRAICLALPETVEKLAWGEPTWRVRGRLFAQLDDHHHGADHLAVWLPAPLGEQEAMIFTDPARFFRPPYVGQRGWVGVRIDRRPDWAVVRTLVEQAYRQVAPPRLCEALSAAARDKGRA